jgi:dCTP diphosphatase
MSENGSPSARFDLTMLSRQVLPGLDLSLDVSAVCHPLRMPISDLQVLRDRMRGFSRARDWEKFHDPKSLVLALVGEVGELAELFQWLPADQAVESAKSGPLNDRVGEELSDILIYLVRLADIAGVDLPLAVERKLNAAEERFPADGVRGSAPVKE